MLMREKDYSQLPVMSDEGEVEGIITWESIGRSLAGGVACKLVRDCMEPYEKVKMAHFDDHLLDSTKDIAGYGYVLVMGDDGRDKRILTASDLADKFRGLAEGFLRIEEIENLLERLVDSKFSDDERLSAGGKRHCGRVSFTLGQYPQFLEKPERWNLVGLNMSYETFVEEHGPVTCIRNAIMHFDPGRPTPEDLQKLREYPCCLRGRE